MKAFKEFVDDDGRHFSVYQFSDGSGRFFRKRPTDDDRSIPSFEIRGGYAMVGMDQITAMTAFTLNQDTHTQQNLRNLMREAPNSTG